MKVGKLLLLLQLLFLAFASNGQVLVTTAPFSTASSQLEQDGRIEVIKMSNNEFVSISKVKGGLTGDSEYLLEKYDFTLKPSFKTPITVTQNEEIKEIYFNGKEIILMTVFHNTDLQITKLLATGFNPQTGVKTWNKTLHEIKINPWLDVKFRGEVKESFENSINSSITKGFVAPVQYQFEVKFSPDSNKVLAYIYDYSQKTLTAAAHIYDRELNPLSDGIVPIDNNFINYGLYPNNKGEVFVLNADHLGRIVVVKYNLKTKANDLLDIQTASTNRESLFLKVISDQVLYVANTNTKDGKFVGVMYSKFNFETKLIEKINFHELSTGLRQTITTSRKGNKALVGDETWLNYAITHFIVNEFEKIIIVIEKREITTTGYRYDAEGVNDVNKWHEREGKVNTEGIIFFSFNVNDEIIWENFYLKSQVTDITIGLTSASFVLDNSAEGKLRMIYASADNTTGLFNILNYVELDEYNGNKIKEIALPNVEKIGLVRNYTLWWENQLLVVGRKGLLGKKTVVNLYKL